MKVLLADDSDYVRASLTKMLSENDRISCVFEAATIVKARELLSSERPDVMILDLSFPEGSGFEVLKYARENNCVGVVIILTNYPNDPMKNKCMKDGADYFFDKSNEFIKAIDVINRLAEIS